jgi:ribose 5-phosphate isomerase B
MQVLFASDHAGFALKNVLLAYVRDELKHAVLDCGAFVFDETDDYPGYIQKAARIVSAHPAEVRAIILGKSGQGEAMAANRFPNVRAAVYYGGEDAIVRLSREHNDANVLSLGAGFLSEADAQNAVRTWLETPFSSDPRHTRRVRDIENV